MPNASAAAASAASRSRHILSFVVQRLGVVLGAAFALAVVLAPNVASPSTSAATRVVDRTFECVNAKHRGFRKVRVSATTGFRHEGRWRWLGAVTLENPNEKPTRLPENQLGFPQTAFTQWSLGISAGTGPWTLDPALPKQDPAVAIWSKWQEACKPAPRRRVPLSGRGLEGGAADYFGDWYSCPAPRRVVARVRAVFASPVAFRLDHATATLKARGPMHVGSIAVRTAAGKPIIFAAVNEAGKTRVLLARSCTG
jgi:hypothetical protein